MAELDKKAGDPLKYYCVVFGLLILVVGYVYFTVSGQRDAYAEENAYAEKLLSGKGMAERDNNGRPNALGDLAIDVEKMVKGYTEAVGVGDEGTGISLTKMQQMANSASMVQVRAGTERRDENRSGGYVEIAREFTYEETSLKNLVTLIYNIEQIGRYRVFEVRWQLQDERKNTEPPFNLIAKPTLKVGYREPLATGTSR